ncbi:hypothetical protein DCS_00927 [Drechmeria coniospora]|uniref:Oxidoreductase n=1 Tax=Drechmeria coniospora TaxID=98403 RepID=A0A151GRS4_DRECN|nr:hypothetical protein DCS_00927 [Drechmeria coniospora]KYK59793.1 hypothetical protein DCS_00927 [Drechmeria coniospora]ODA78593.1 hypothetical protein RJ55_05975 [Drechmeria coniospora]
MPSLPWILVCPSSRGIGHVLTRHLLLATSLPILATTRHGDPLATKAALLDGLPCSPSDAGSSSPPLSRRLTLVRCDVTDESSIADAAAAAAELFPPATHHLHLACVLPGILHAEKSPLRVDAERALESFRVNALGPLLLAKHFVGFLPRRATNLGREEEEALDGPATGAELVARLPRHATWLSVAARVGSTSDNRSGGWYSYRASKAAVISLAKSLDHFLAARSGDKALAVAYHPGTVRTDLSRPFWSSTAEGKLFEPVDAVDRLVRVLGALEPRQRGRCWDWKGEEILP